MTSQPKFKAIPTHAQLASIDRDLTFHPSTVQDPKYLTPEQIAHYNREGYIKGLRVLSAEELVGPRSFLDSILARVMAQGASSYSILSGHMKYGAIWDLITHPRIT